jgi:UDP-glucose 4-epimerase
MQSCLVLGGGGFLGINLCHRLVAAGFRVRAFGRGCLFPAALEGVEWQRGDFSDAGSVADAIGSVDVVFHLIHNGTPQSATLDMTGDIRHNLLPSLALLEMVRTAGAPRIVFVSSGGTIYGRAERIPTPETSLANPITAYGITKLAIEKYLGLYEHLYGLDYRVLRLTNPFGPYQVPVKNQGLIAAIISRALRGESIEIWGDGKAIRDFIFVDDAIEALLLAALDQSNQRVFNIGSGQGRSVKDVIALIEHVMNQRLDIHWNAGRPIDVPRSVVTIDRARDVLRWLPKTSFEAGLERTIDWWRSFAL